MTLQQVHYQGICAGELQPQKHKYVALSVWIQKDCQGSGQSASAGLLAQHCTQYCPQIGHWSQEERKGKYSMADMYSMREQSVIYTSPGCAMLHKKSAPSSERQDPDLGKNPLQK